jgi:FkbM family methyltransferase
MLSLETLLGRILHLPLSLIPPDTEVRILRGPLRGKKWIVGSGPHAYWVGTYEVNHLGDFGAAIGEGTVVYDVGANVGIYSLLASSRTGPSGKVYAFEPLERNVQYLRRHMSLNRAQNCVILQTAVSNLEGTRQFSGDSEGFSMGRLSPKGEILVPSTTIDNCIYGEKKLPPPNFLKIDVEGAEMELLLGGSRALAEFHPKIFLEMHSGELYSECREFLAARGYRMEEKYTHVKATWRSAALLG